MVAALLMLQGFVVLIVLMLTYPGGYRFSEYTVSMLGSHFSQANHERNFIGHDVGLLSYFLLGCGSALTGVLLARRIGASGRARWIARIGMIVAIVSAPGPMLGQIFSHDSYHRTHVLISEVFTPLLMVAILLFTVAILVSRCNGQWLAYAGLVAVALLAYYAFIRTTPISQKVAIGALLGWWQVAAFSLWHTPAQHASRPRQ